MKTKLFYYLSILLLISGCTALIKSNLDSKYGPAHPVNRITNVPQQLALAKDARAIFDSRCAVCHGCYDAPCQLRLDSFEGIERGAHKDKVYDGSRLFAAAPTRLLYDADTVNQWRTMHFFPAINERQQSAEANINGSLIASMLALKQRNPLPNSAQLPEDFTFSLDREQQCPTIEEFEQFASKHPLWGMPYALPALSQQENNVLINWIQNGALYGYGSLMSAKQQGQIDRWEKFLNGTTLKERIMSRYFYEHLFISNLYFETEEERKFYRLVRSRTAPGEKIDVIATRFPYDDPGVNQFYYRLKPVSASILAKTHIPYALSNKRMERLRELFLIPDFNIDNFPSYSHHISANPFKAFKDIPVASRYRFLLDDAQSFINGFIKGPVCRGQVAVDVVNDHFWVFFIDPDSTIIEHDSEFLARESDHLQLPNEEDSDGLNVLTWFKYSQRHRDYLLAKQAYLKKYLSKAGGMTLDLIWQGDGFNDNAALTVFRHFDSATVVKGLVGRKPKTSWVMGYSLLERIHYLLVAGFDVYGNVRHQLYARLYMDFLRMEGEFNFLTALPSHVRESERDNWYRGAHESVKEYIDWSHNTENIDTNIAYTSANQKLELYDKLSTHLDAVLNRSHTLESETEKDLVRQLDKLNAATGKALSYMPELSFLYVMDAGANDKVFTITRNSAHSNITHLFSEKTERLPEEDTLTVSRGFIGAYPNAFFSIKKSQAAEFVTAITALSAEITYKDMLDKFAIRRTSAQFWAHSDLIHALYRKSSPIEAGLFDYNRLENR